MSEVEFPTIGDIILSQHSKVKDGKGNDRYDLLECDGSEFVKSSYTRLSTIIVPNVVLSQEELISNVSNHPNGVCASTDGKYIYVRVNADTYNSTGYIYKSENYGVDFTNAFSFTTGWNYGIACSDNGEILYFTSKLNVYKSTDYGNSAVAIYVGTDLHGVACSSDGVHLAYADGSNRDIYYRNAGVWDEFEDILIAATTSIVWGEYGMNLYFSDSTSLKNLDISTGTVEVVHVFSANIYSISRRGSTIYVIIDNEVHKSSDGFLTIDTKEYSAALESYFNTEISELVVSSNKLYDRVTNVFHTPSIASLDPRVPYKIVGDLT